MIEATKRILDPNDPRYGQPDDGPNPLTDPNAPIEPSPSGDPTSPITQSPAAPTPEPTIDTTQPTADSGVDTRGGATGITQLPDGNGGTVAVPPPELAPQPYTPDPIAPPTAPPPIDPMPWEPQAPLTNPIPIDAPIAAAPEPIAAPTTPADATPWMPWEPEVVAPTPAAPAPVEPATAPPQPTPPLVIDPPPATGISSAPVPLPGQAVTGAATQQPVGVPDFTADENLITSQILATPDPRMLALQEAGDMGLDALANEAAILPTADPRLDALQAQGDAGLTALAQEAPIVPQADPRLLRYREETDALMDKILNGPDRLEMAKQFYRNFDQETEQDYKDSLKDATDAGAAHGQLFSGQLTNKYGDLFSRRARDKDSAKNRFMDEALRETFADRDRAFGQLGDVENRIFGQGQDERGELRTERDNRRRVISDFYSERDNALATGRSDRNEARGERANRQGTVDQYYNERDKALVTGRNDRNETRDERDYQQGSAEAALLNRIRQYQAEQAGQQQDFGNAGTLTDYGNEGDPTDTYMDAAEQASLEAAAAAGDTGALLRLLAMRRQGAGTGLTAGG